MSHHRLFAHSIACVGLLLPIGRGALAAAPADFQREIRPLLARHCTACHGGVKAAGGISFLYRDKALSTGKSGARAIVPGSPELSEVMRRVLSTDPEEVMPKPDHGPRLTTAETDALQRWIQGGAAWSEHWSFVPPEEPPRPRVRGAGWVRSSLDAFILDRLERENLRPSPEASPAEWLRRVSLDLTGLPPTPQEYQLYTEDRQRSAGKAREHAVDRLLGSPRFGERWAAVWLDLARYSDTFGFEKDPRRDIWPWRDWVIRAFNADMPFDQFTIRQLAGDLLPNPSADDLLATAFHRNTQNNTEGGTDDEEYRTAAVLDRVNTTWTAWNATTFGCVQCHSHPYDPIEKRDYYRFAAFFNNTEDCDQNDDFPRYLFASDMARRDEAVALQREVRRQRESLNESGLAVARRVASWVPLVPTAARLGSGEGSLNVAADGRIHAVGTLPLSVAYTLTVPATAGMTALRIDIFPESDAAGQPPERGQIFSKLAVSVVVPGSSNRPVRLKEVIVDHLAGPRDPWKILEGDGGFGSYPVMTGPRWGVVVLERPLEVPDGTRLELTFEHGIASNSNIQGCQLRHFALSFTRDASLSDLANAPARTGAWKEWLEARERLKKIPGTSVPVMLERPRAGGRETREFVRGNRLTLAETVQPGIPAVVRPPEATLPPDRLEMARWLVGDRNPLAARVLANRLWAEMFGHGIVETLEDFGTSGARPSHPELLDHLALRLRGDLGWSVKRFLREIALSSTYAQSAAIPARLLEKDPGNRLLARGPRSRLTAEMVRDQALSLSGLLSTNMFGPPVYPPQPDGIWSTVYSGDQWNTATNENRFRRALYTFNRRTAGYPLFLTFDVPTRDACAARRVPSNTPLQALSVLNDPAFIEMAQSLAKRMEAGGGSVRQQIERGVRLLTLDRPPRQMIDSLVRLHDGALADYRAAAASAEPLGKTDRTAAMVLVANALLNLDPAMVR